MKRNLKLVGVVLLIAAGSAVAADAASSPTVATGGTSSTTTTTTILHGTVNPNGASTSYRFEWGLTTGYGISGTVKSAGSGTHTVSVAFKIADLIPGTVYHYRLLALNRFGGAIGSDRTFTTAGNPPPQTATGPAQVTSATTATVTGVINPRGASTTYTFQYGITPFYGSSTFSQTVPAGSLPVNVSAQLSGLAPGTFFHYRIVAIHSVSSSVQYGADETFMTFPSPRPRPRVPARTTPGRDKHKPFVFTTSGKVIGPASIPKSLSCFQNATVHFMLGRRLVGFALADVLPDCSFKTQTVFNHLPGRGKKNRQVHLRVFIHFRGNGYLAPSDATPERVTLG
jgi:phosphodiesterase/alkaline phosphatase D-like protein